MTAMTAMNEMAEKAGMEAITLDGDFLRSWSRSQQYSVTREGLQAYAEATNDTRPERVAGDEGSPAYTFVPFTALLFAAAAELGGGALDGRLVHTHQEFVYAEPIVPGDELTVNAWISVLRNGPFGSVMQMTATTERADGTRLSEQIATCLVVASSCVNPIGDEAPAEPREAAGRRPGAKTASVAIDADHPQRYADASGDHNPIHLDNAAARAAGFPGQIVHGMCTLALSVSGIEATHPQTRSVANLKIEFTRPVFPRDRLTVRWTEETDEAGRIVASFDVVNRKQRTVMRGGVLTLVP